MSHHQKRKRVGEAVVHHSRDPGLRTIAISSQGSKKRGSSSKQKAWVGSKRQRQEADGDEELDFRALRREVMEFGATGFSHTAKKEHDARRVMALGGHAPKNPKVPIKILRGMQSKLKKRNEQAQAEYLTNRVATGVVNSLSHAASGKTKRSGLFYMEQSSPLDVAKRKKAEKLRESRLYSDGGGRDASGLLSLGQGKDMSFSGGVLKVKNPKALRGPRPDGRGRGGRGRGARGRGGGGGRGGGAGTFAKSMRRRRK